MLLYSLPGGGGAATKSLDEISRIGVDVSQRKVTFSNK